MQLEVIYQNQTLAEMRSFPLNMCGKCILMLPSSTSLFLLSLMCCHFVPFSFKTSVNLLSLLFLEVLLQEKCNVIFLLFFRVNKAVWASLDLKANQGRRYSINVHEIFISVPFVFLLFLNQSALLFTGRAWCGWTEGKMSSEESSSNM